MAEAWKGLLASKKFWSGVVGVAAILIGKIGWNVSEDVLWQITAIIATLLGAQGAADWGKAAKVP